MNYSSKVDECNKQVHGIEKKNYSELVVSFSPLLVGQSRFEREVRKQARNIELD